MPFVENLEYENLNSLRSYPIRDGLSKTDVTNVFTIPNDFIVDMQIAAGGVASATFFISQIENVVNQYVVTISDGSSNVVGSFTIPVSGFTQNSIYPLQTVPGNYSSANGSITIYSLGSISQLPVGLFTFALSATELLPRVVIVSIQAVNQIAFTDSNGTLQTLTNFVNIEARNNLRYSFDSINNILILDAGDGLGLNTQCTTPVCIQSINGVLPDPTTGNLNFNGLGCSNVASTAAYTLTLEDQCCTPCTSCDDLTTLTSRVNQLEQSYNNVKNLYTYLNVELTAFTNTVNASCQCYPS